MSDAHEQSYYEIALTNRQVLVAFVILLSCVLVAFFAGVWVGRGAPQPVSEPAAPAETVADAAFEDPKEFEFFNEGEVPEARPNLREIAENPNPGTTLAEDLGLEEKPKAPAEPAPRATPPPSEPVATEGTLVIQVFSSRDEVQARRLVTTLQEGGYQAFLSQAESNGVMMFRVRIGPFRDRGRAETVANEVRDRFKVSTWITSP